MLLGIGDNSLVSDCRYALYYPLCFLSFSVFLGVLLQDTCDDTADGKVGMLCMKILMN